MKKQQKTISLNNETNKYCVLDTETIHSGKVENNQVIGVKDVIEISWKMLDNNGLEIYGSKKGFIVKEFWENKAYLLSDNYEQDKKTGTIKSKQNFAINKIVKWEKAISENVLQVKSWGEIMKQLNDDLINYQITLFSAYNIRFDRGAIVDTSKMIPYRNYCPALWKIDYIDIMEMIKVIAKDKNFKIWSDNHKNISPKGNYKVTAEAIYRHLTNNSTELETIILDSSSWSETHLAIEDIDCEGVIVQGAISLARKKRDIKVNINCYGNWSTLNKIIKSTKTPRKKKIKEQQMILLFNE